MYLSLQYIGGGRRAGVEIEVITTMCNLSFLVERLISGNRNLFRVTKLVPDIWIMDFHQDVSWDMNKHTVFIRLGWVSGNRYIFRV